MKQSARSPSEPSPFPALDGRTGSSGRVLAAMRRVERAFDRFFGERANPLRQLGALGFHLFWLVALTGAYLYVFYETSASGAYASVERLGAGAAWGGALVRSLHRYGSDALVVVVAAHLLREWAYGRYRGFRAFTWLTGVPAVWLIVAAGAIGYWLVWDSLALFVATAIAEAFGALPGFDVALVRNFVDEAAVSDRLFSLLMFLHIGVSLGLLLVLWLHVQRLARPRTNPALPLAVGTLVSLALASWFAPAVSHAPADLAHLGGALAIDWFYLAAFPAFLSIGPLATWSFALAATLLVAAAPWIGRERRPAVAVVEPEYCNGCTRCFADCPYEAIEMVPRPDGRGRIAQVDAGRCAACGICTGACPSATPLRGGERFVSGIDLPEFGVEALRNALDAQLDARAGARPVVVFGCRDAAPASSLPAGTVALALPCAGMLPPSFVEYALRRGARGVVVASCPSDDCEFRFGAQWTAQRLQGEREPRLRAAVDRERVRRIAAAREDRAMLEAEFREFLHHLERIDRTPPSALGAVPTHSKEKVDVAAG